MDESKQVVARLWSEPVATDLRVGGELVTADRRRELKRALAAGELDELVFDALVFRDGQNANFVRFRPAELPMFASSFAGQPFLRDHNVREIAARDGTIRASRLESGAFIQQIALTTQRGMQSFLEEQIDRFSIGWYYTAVTCSVCGEDFRFCAHWPGETYEVRDAEGAKRAVLCEAIFEGARGKETSAVNTPAVDGTTVLAQLCEMKAGVSRETGERDGNPETLGRGGDGGGLGEQAGREPVMTTQEVIAMGDQVDGVATQGAPALPDWVGYLRRQATEAALAASGLPEAARQVVRSQVSEETTPAQLDELIDGQRRLIAELQKDQVVTGLNRPLDGRVGGMQTSLDRVETALEALIAGRTPAGGVRPLSGIREAYTLLSGDFSMKGVFEPENVSLANVNSTTMAGIVANALNKVVVTMFQAYPRWWAPIVIEQDFATLQEVKWITLGGVGELPTVAEGAAYDELTWDDQTETAAWVKKGGYLGITLETIDKDDTGRVQNAPRALAQSAWLTLSKGVSNIFTSNSGVGPTMSDSKALFHTDHGNLGTAALTGPNYAAAKLAMRKQTELHSGERLGALTAPKFVLVPSDLENAALTVLASENMPGTANNDVNPEATGDTHEARMAAARRKLIVVDLWTDTNNWAAVADPMLYPSIGIGYRYGRTPEITSVADRNSGLMFSNDTLPIKVRWFYAVGPTDWRGLYKQNVA